MVEQASAPVGADVAQTPPGQIVELLLGLGRASLENGAPVYLAEQAVLETAVHFGVPIQVKLTPSELVAVAGAPGAQPVIVRRVEPAAINIRRLIDLATLRAAILAGNLDAQVALRRLDQVCAPTPGSGPLLVASLFALLALGIGVILGGGWRELLASGAAGFTAGLVTVLSRQRFVGAIINELLAAAAGSVVGIALALLIGSYSTGLVVTAAFIALLPGAALLTGFLEIGHIQTMAGVERLTDAGIKLLALVAGVALAKVLANLVPELLEATAVIPVPAWMLPIAFACFVLVWAILMRARPGDLVWIFASCLLGMVLVTLSRALLTTELATVLNAFVIGAAAQLGSRRLGLSSALLALPGITLLLPGTLALTGVVQFLSPRFEQGILSLFQTALTLVLLGTGLALRSPCSDRGHGESSADPARGQCVAPATPRRTAAAPGIRGIAMVIANDWWVLALRGTAALLLGVAFVAWPRLLVHILVLGFGGYLALAGLLGIAAALLFPRRDKRTLWTGPGLLGLLSAGTGLGLLVWQDTTILLLRVVIALWAIVTAALDLTATVQRHWARGLAPLARQVDTTLLQAIGAGVQLVFGLWLFPWLDTPDEILRWVLVGYLWLEGVVLLALARLAREERQSRTP